MPSNVRRKNAATAFSLACAFGSSRFESRADSIGSSVKLTNIEMMTAALMVRPNCLKN